MKICIDPGHSGPFEPGACAGEVTEAELNLIVAKKLGLMLSYCGYEVIYTRKGNIEDDELLWRTEFANQQQADLFISIHCNAADSEEVRGFEIYHYPESTESNKLAESIHRAFLAFPYTLDRGVKDANFTVLKETNMPAVLIELAFLSSALDRQLLTSEILQTMMTLIISSGIHGYLVI